MVLMSDNLRPLRQGEVLMAEQKDEVRVSIRMPSDHADALRQRAVEGDRSFSAEIRRLIRCAVEGAEKGPEMA